MTWLVFLSFETTQSFISPSNILTPSYAGRRAQPSASVRHAVNPLEDETPEELQHRMELVKDLQKIFYQNEQQVEGPGYGSTQIADLPLFRAEWAELPGYQRVLHVTAPNYIHMFHAIMNSESMPRYFGHLFLPGGCDNIDAYDYRLELGSLAPLTGALMQITDYTQLEDGSLLVIVQALERIRVVNNNVKRHGFPFGIATVEVVPDEELQNMHHDSNNIGNYKERTISRKIYEGSKHPNAIHHAEAVAEAFQMHPFEFRPSTLQEYNIKSKEDVDKVYQLVSYNGSLGKLQKHIGNDFMTLHAEQNVDELIKMEYEIWVRIDKMIQRLMRILGDPPTSKLPMPYQFLSLLPSRPYKPWPAGFMMEDYARHVENEQLMEGTIHTHMFVRVDDRHQYSTARRVQRLSYALWPLTEIVLREEGGEGFKQSILEMHSTTDRLTFAISKFEKISYILRNVLNEV